MDGSGTIGKYVLVVGAVIAALGAILIVLEKFGGLRIGKLPGDIYIRRDGWSFYFPLMTCILISLILTLILWFFRRR